MATDTLPEGILTRVQALGAALVEVARQHRDAPLGVLEQEVLERVRQAQGGLLEEVVGRAISALAPAQRRLRATCPGCGRRAKARDWRVRTVRTVCGTLRFERAWYGCRGCGHGWSPADATLGLAPRARLSVGLRGWVMQVGAEAAFKRASGRLAELSGQVLSKETIRRHCERQGARLGAEAAAAAAHVLAAREAAEVVDPAPGHLVVETDGVLVRYLDGWHEVKLGLVAGHQAGELVAPSYVAARTAAEAFGPLLLAEAARRAGDRGLGGWAGWVWPGGPAGGGGARGWGGLDLEPGRRALR